MKSAADQAAVTAKVQETYAEYPSLADVPELADPNVPVKASVTVGEAEEGFEQTAYVVALYELFSHAYDATLVGKVNGNMLVAN